MSRFVYLPDEPMDNLIPWTPQKPKMLTKETMGNPFDRYNEYIQRRKDMGVTDFSCSHFNDGLWHFWGNPEMEEPCRISYIDGQWYLRKSCADVPPREEWWDNT